MNRINQNLTIITKYLLLSFILIGLIFLQNSFAQNIKNNDEETTPSGVAYMEEVSDSLKFSPIAMLQILNKTTAKNLMIDLKVGQKVNLGAITLKAHKCWQAPLEQKPETKILLEVFENKNPESNVNEVQNSRIFYGWIFASSPSISGVQHPIYDIVAIACKTK